MAKAKAEKAINAPRVYSYVRFSTPEQELGDSERRQVDKAKAWAVRKGLTFDESLSDRGLSGFHGVHRTHGAMGHFLERVVAGQVPTGSIIVVENSDRLGREGPAKMLQGIIFKLWDNGISIVTLSPEETYDPGCDGSPKFIGLLIYLQRAYDESKRKSEVITDARESARRRAREDGTTLTKQLPAWLRDKDGQRIPIPEAAATIELMFDLKLKGLSTRALEKHLNANALWMPVEITKKGAKRRRGGNGWRSSYINKILRNPAVIGIYQPFKRNPNGKPRRIPACDPIENYFPMVIKPETFHAVQKLLEVNKGKGGKTGKGTNLFRYVVKCAYCGGPMRIDDKGKPPKGAKYLYCDYGTREVRIDGKLVCRKYGVRYDECEKLVLENCPKLRPEQVLPHPAEQAKRSKALRNRLQGIDGELSDIERRLENLDFALEEADSPALRERLFKNEVKLQQRKSELGATRKQVAQGLAEAERNVDSLQTWKDGFESLSKALAEDNPELRMMLHAHLREFIDRIDVFAHGHQKPYKKANRSVGANLRRTKDGIVEIPDSESSETAIDEGDDFEETQYAIASEFYPDMLKKKSFTSFLAHITELRRTKAGRFFRVYFKTGKKFIDLAPIGSLASGQKLSTDRKNWLLESPDLNALWQKHLAKTLPPTK